MHSSAHFDGAAARTKHTAHPRAQQQAHQGRTPSEPAGDLGKRCRCPLYLVGYLAPGLSGTPSPQPILRKRGANANCAQWRLEGRGSSPSFGGPLLAGSHRPKRGRLLACEAAKACKELSGARIQTHFTLLLYRKNSCPLGEKRYRKDLKFTLSVPKGHRECSV